MKLLNNFFTIVGGNESCVHIRLHATHPVFRAHFPGNPITPGACIVQAIGELLSVREGQKLVLHRANSVKFVSPLKPQEQPVVSVVFQTVDHDDGGRVTAKGHIETNGDISTKFALVFAEVMNFRTRQ